MSQSLEDLLQKSGNPAQMLRNSQIGAYVYPVVPAEFPIGAMNSAPGAIAASFRSVAPYGRTCM